MKQCFKCKIEKDNSSFYSHKQTKDGFSGKCISCTKIDVKNLHNKKKNDLSYIDKIRKRNRDRYHKSADKIIAKKDIVKSSKLSWSNKYPEKLKATKASIRMIAPFAELEKRHWSYNEEHVRDVIWLTRKDHLKAHRFIVYDQERFMYRRFDNNILLDTKEDHEKFIKDCILSQED